VLALLKLVWERLRPELISVLFSVRFWSRLWKAMIETRAAQAEIVNGTADTGSL